LWLPLEECSTDRRVPIDSDPNSAVSIVIITSPKK
jgi:hypothetical protein